MQLEQIKTVGAQVAQPFFDILAQVAGWVAFFGQVVRAGRPAAGQGWGFGGHVDLFAAFGEHLCDQLFAFAVAIAGCGVDQIDAVVDGLVESGQRILVVLGAPAAADGPSAEPDCGNVQSAVTQWPILHGELLWCGRNIQEIVTKA